MTKSNKQTAAIRGDKASSQPVVVRGHTAPDGQRWVEVVYKGATTLIEYAQFASDRGAIWATLAHRGLVFVRKADKTSLIDQVEELEEFSPRLIFTRPGWCAGQFANVSGRVFSPPGVVKGTIAFTPNPVKCSKRGTHAAWRREIAAPLTGHHIPCFMIMAAFAAPMLEIISRPDNFGFELAGEGGKGKSTTQRLVASVVGPAMVKDRGYITTFYATPAALEQSMQSHADHPFIIDEANLFGSGEGSRTDRSKMRDFAFQMASGTTKKRFDSPDQEGYRFIYMTSANEPFNERLAATHQNVADAATDRLMTITVPDGDAGVFGPLSASYAGYRQFTLALEAAMSQQFGTAMPKFLNKLVKAHGKDSDKLKAKIRFRIEKFVREVGASDGDGSLGRVAEAFGLVYAAGDFAQFYGVVPREWDCLTAAVHCYLNFRSRVPTRQPLAERLLAIAARPETIAIDRKNLPTLSDEQMKAAGAFIRVVKGEKLLLMTTEFGDRMFPDWNALKGTADFVALNCANDKGRGRGYHCRIRANRKVDWFYAFRLPERVDDPE